MHDKFRCLVIFLAIVTSSLSYYPSNYVETQGTWDTPMTLEDVRFTKFVLIFKKAWGNNYRDIWEYNLARSYFTQNYKQIVDNNKKYKRGLTKLTERSY